MVALAGFDFAALIAVGRHPEHCRRGDRLRRHCASLTHILTADRLGLDNRLEVEPALDQTPVVNRIDILGREYGFVSEHHAKP
jgi:hypothetical protein